MKIGVLAIQGAVSEHINSFQRLGYEAIPVKTKESLKEVDGLIIPGGESTTIARIMQKFQLDEAIKSLVNQGLPVYGTCAGMILLAKKIKNDNQYSLGILDITVVRNAFGRQVESMEVDLEVKGLDTPFHAVFIRAPVAEEPSPEVEILSTLKEGIVFLREKNIMASAFHPELGDDLRIHRLFLDMVYKKI